jgi:hypothetical protein
MTDGFGDAFDEVFAADETADAGRGAAPTWAGDLAAEIAHDASVFSPNTGVVRGAEDVAQASWQEAESLSGGHPLSAAAQGVDEVFDKDPRAVWDDMKPDDELGQYAQPAVDEAGTAAFGGVQLGADILGGLGPDAVIEPATQIAFGAYDAAASALPPDDDTGHFKDPEIPETDAMSGSPGQADDAPSYDTVESYDSYDSYDASGDDTDSAMGSTFGSDQDTGSPFADDF